MRNIERYRVLGFGLWAVCLKETGEMIGDWTFDNTPFNIVYSYMKNTNEPSYKTAVSYGCKQVDEYKDDVNEITKVFAITREEWINR